MPSPSDTPSDEAVAAASGHDRTGAPDRAAADERADARGVPRIGRALDLVGLLLFSAGGGCYAWAWTGFRRVRAFQSSPEDPPWAAVRMADGYWRLQKMGVALMIAGVAVFVLAWWVARRVGRSGDGGHASDASVRTGGRRTD